jgi:hypothetical protein
MTALHTLILDPTPVADLSRLKRLPHAPAPQRLVPLPEKAKQVVA